MRTRYIPDILALTGAAALAIFFDASFLVWVLAIAAAVIVALYELAEWRGVVALFPIIRLGFFSFAVWEWLSAAYALSALQVIPVWGTILLLVPVAIAFVFLYEQSRLAQITHGSVFASAAFLLAFAPTSFYARGFFAALIFALVGMVLWQLDHAAPRARTIITAIIGCAALIISGITFQWFL